MTVVVLCCHRGGSSAVAGMLHHLGVHMGDDLLGPKRGSNPKGHYEDRDFGIFGRYYLKRRGGDWHDPPSIEKLDETQAWEKEEFGRIIKRKERRPLWGWKDPQTVLYIKNFLRLVPQPFLLWVEREKEACVASLLKRNPERLCRSEASELCDLHISRYEEIAKENEVFVLPYKELLERPGDFIKPLAERLGTEETQEAYRFLDPKLRHF